jgi:glycerol-3-phosphate acyltransferase PlsY
MRWRTPDAAAATVLIAHVSLAGGYLAGSIPVSALVGRRVCSPGASDPGAVWRAAGPGPGLLAVSGELARGALPVAVAVVTLSWAAGALAGLGAVLGSAWPALARRIRGAPGLTLGGAAYALAPAAGSLALGPALVAAIVAHAARRDVVAAAATAWLLAYPILFLVAAPDASQALALVPLYAVLAVRRPGIPR